MIKEEEKLHKESEKNEEKIKAQHDKLWSSLGDDERKQKYSRLQFLLSKSNMYTQYLLERMNRQQEEEKKRQERHAKRLAKQEHKTKAPEAEQSQKKDNSKSPQKKDNSEFPQKKDNSESPQREDNSEALPKEQLEFKDRLTVKTEPVEESVVSVRTPLRRGRRRKGDNSAVTDGLASSQESIGSTKSSRGRKRKVEAKSPDIRKFISSAGKKQRLEDGSAASMDGDKTEIKRENDTDSIDSGLVSDKSGGQTEIKRENDTDSIDCVESKNNETNSSACDSEHKPPNVSDNCVDSVDMETHEPTNQNNETTDCDKLSNHSQESEKTEQEDPLGQPSLFTGGTLRDYQIDGFNWLKMLYENGVNGILADEMGLGKTVQCIGLVAHLVSMGVPGPFLVCAPLSTLPNWHSEFLNFTPTIPIILYHGSKEQRAELRKKIKKWHPVKKNVEVHPVVLTSYEISMNDRRFLQYFEWKYLIVDEGHRIKNTHCRLIRELRLYRNTHRLLLTGTPLQNNLAELWSLLNFLLPEIFDDLTSFEAWFDVEHLSGEDADARIIAEEQQGNILSMLHQILTPFMLRRLKSDVDLKIPPKKEIVVYAALLKPQQALYSALIDRTILKMLEEKNSNKSEEPTPEVNAKGRPVRRSSKKKVDYSVMLASDKDLRTPTKQKEKDEEEIEEWVRAVVESQNDRMAQSKSNQKKVNVNSQITIKLTNIMMQLRKCCNHPYLLEYPLDPTTGNYRVDDELIRSSGKMSILDQMLQELKRQGHKVLIFSQMTKMLDIIEDYCYYRHYEFCRLDGSCKVEERQEQMKTFNTDPNMFVFLLSTRAGGLGINLVAADTVIIYDSDWNPQSDLQAQDRCHRIGQTRPVVVYRYVTSNSIDQKIVERASAKRKLEKMVIHQEKFKSGMKNFNSSLAPLSSSELLDLLKSKDHQAVASGQENVLISKKSLDRLLDRSDLMQKWEDNINASTAKKSKRKTGGNTESLFKVIDLDD
ncbi:hypothetical protein ScPMuIL_012433 [Solemya velum]